MRFSLQSVFLSFVLIWSSLAAFGWGGLLLGLALVMLAGSIRAQPRNKGFIAVLLLLSLGLFILCQPPLVAGRQAACRACMNRLVEGLHAYHNQHGSFPPAYIADSDGKPMHSWRVLILPFLGEQAVYDKYNFNEPWNGPNNRRLAPDTPYLFRCHCDRTSAFGCTNYVAVVGPQAAWLGATPRRLAEFGDHGDRTILLVEISTSDINWLEPRDLSFDVAKTGIHDAGEPGISSHHPVGDDFFHQGQPHVNVGFAEGEAFFLRAGTPLETLEALLTIEYTGEESIERGHPFPIRLRWDRIVALIAMAVSFLLLLVRPRRGQTQRDPTADPNEVDTAEPEVSELPQP